jgi:hypothetical protein
MVQIRENVFSHVQKLILSRHGFDISAAVVVAIVLLLFFVVYFESSNSMWVLCPSELLQTLNIDSIIN